MIRPALFSFLTDKHTWAITGHHSILVSVHASAYQQQASALWAECGIACLTVPVPTHHEGWGSPCRKGRCCIKCGRPSVSETPARSRQEQSQR